MLLCTVLVVDDHHDSREICEIILSRNGYRVVSAPDGARGLELARAEYPSAIVLDLALPRMDGWAVIAELRRDPVTVAIPVVLYTAHSSDSDRSRAREVGCSGYLVKPCSPQAILQEVRLAVGANPGAPPAVPAAV